MTDAKNQLTTYLYDKGNRLVETDFADGRKNSFGYDVVGNMTSYANADVSAVIAYDAANRKTSETVTMGGFTKTYSYTYDGKGNKASFTTPEGTSYGYTYNKNSQPTQITTPAGAISLAYQWNRQTKVTLPNGISTDYAYNANSWLTDIRANNTKVTPPVPFTTTSYTFDNVGNITGKANGITTSYGYDKIYQLLSSTNSQNSETFTYDQVGNRKTSAQTQGSWSYDKNNELLSYDGVTFGYDANGNTVTQTEGTDTTTYVYGTTDRLESVQLPDGETAFYNYDPFGRRVKKQVGAEVTYFLYADEGLIGEYSGSGAFIMGYGWRPAGIWGTNPVFMVEGGTYYFYHNDHLGTPQKMTDINGNTVWSATYSAFGEATVAVASTVESNLRFPGQYFDAETGNNYNFLRDYDPSIGRYVNKDPIGFNGGDVVLYGYVGANPVNKIDPYGLREWSIDRKGISAAALIFSGSLQILTFVSNCENKTKLKKTYLVLGGGLGLGLGVKNIKLKQVSHTGWGNSKGRLGSTQIANDPKPLFGISVSGPAIALLNFAGVGGVTLGTANIAFDPKDRNSYSEVYALSTGPGLTASIFNFEGQLYIHLKRFDESIPCCK